jgi:putative transposase
MLKNHKLAKSINNIGFYEFKRQLEYKCNWYGKELILANRFYPSSKLCSCCGNKKNDLKLSDRIYCCSNCELKIDRDLNAAINLKQYTVRHTGINAGGDDKVHVDNLLSIGGRQRSQNQTKNLHL